MIDNPYSGCVFTSTHHFLIWIFIAVLPALGYWLDNKIKRFIWLSAFAAVIFRSELCILVGPLLLLSLLRRKIDLVIALKHAVLAGIAALGK